MKGFQFPYESKVRAAGEKDRKISRKDDVLWEEKET